MTVSKALAALGSSPRRRGALTEDGRQQGAGGIIPAQAGSTRALVGTRGRLWDHPRAGGEHPDLKNQDGRFGGSSPRRRGAPVAGLGCRGRPGIIPAQAGSTG